MTILALHRQLQKTFDPLLARLLRPQSLARVATRMPERMNVLLVEQMLNRALTEQIAEGDFDFLQRRVLQVEVLDAHLFVGVSFDRNRLSCRYFRATVGEPDVTLSIASVDAIDLIQQQVDPDTLFFQRKLKINGDTELAHHVKNTIDTLSPEVIPGVLLKLLQLYQRRCLLREEIRMHR